MSDWYHEPALAGDFVDLHARVGDLEAQITAASKTRAAASLSEALDNLTLHHAAEREKLERRIQALEDVVLDLVDQQQIAWILAQPDAVLDAALTQIAQEAQGAGGAA